MRKLLLFLVLILLPFLSEAAFNTSGYISVKNLGGYTYQVTIVDYSIGNPQDTGFCGANDRDTLRIHWGDGNSALAMRSNGTGDSVCDCRKVNIYIGTYTYSGPGTYRLWYDAIGRSAGITNMSGSVGVDMLIFHVLDVEAFNVPSFSSPVVTNPAVCSYGCTSKCYSYNPKTSGGDSISYSLGDCLCLSGVCPGYYIPNGVGINDTTGQLYWCNPQQEGLYNFAILITTFDRETSIIGPDTITMEVAVDTEEVELEMLVQSDCTLGINQLTNNTEYSIYPNPSNGRFMIESSGTTNKSLVEIYNILGEKLYTQALSQSSNETQINLSNKASGIYLYRIISETGTPLSEGKFVIQK